MLLSLSLMNKKYPFFTFRNLRKKNQRGKKKQQKAFSSLPFYKSFFILCFCFLPFFFIGCGEDSSTGNLDALKDFEEIKKLAIEQSCSVDIEKGVGQRLRTLNENNIPSEWGDCTFVGCESGFVKHEVEEICLQQAKKLAIGFFHGCAILNNDSLKCWGNNIQGQLGLGDKQEQLSPITVDLGKDHTAKAIAIGSEHTCAILDDDSLKCWGRNIEGQMGLGHKQEQLSPTAIDLGDNHTVKFLSAGENYTCAILDDDSLKCWGNNKKGQLGLGNKKEQLSPTAIDLGKGHTAKAIATGSEHACAILDDDSLKCWGRNSHGQLGLGHENPQTSPATVDLGNNHTAKAITGGYRHTCAILDDDSLKCWGRNDEGQLGLGNKDKQSSPTAVDLGDHHSAKVVVAGALHSCAILDDDSLKCWGDNSKGGLGLGNTKKHISPVQVDWDKGYGTKVVSIGPFHTCAISSRGRVKCWGRNIEGQLGVGDKKEHKNPMVVDFP